MDFAALIYHRQEFLDGQWWLPFTAQLVHFNFAHGMSNAMVALVLGALFRPMLVWAQQCALILGSAFAVAVVVVSDANCAYYAGASGALYGWAAGGCLITIFSWSVTSQPHRRIALFVLCLLVVRLVAMQWAGVGATAWGFPVYLPAHWAGLVGGLAMASFFMRRKTTPAQTTHRQQSDER